MRGHSEDDSDILVEHNRLREKIHWVSWKRLTLPKTMGGMGFREMVDFNMTMCTKTAWRLQNERSAILAKVMKGLYLPRSEFMNTTKGVRPSWAWASFLVWKDVLKANGVWRVGNGRNIKSLHDA